MNSPFRLPRRAGCVDDQRVIAGPGRIEDEVAAGTYRYRIAEVEFDADRALAESDPDRRRQADERPCDFFDLGRHRAVSKRRHNEFAQRTGR